MDANRKKHCLIRNIFDECPVDDTFTKCENAVCPWTREGLRKEFYRKTTGRNDFRPNAGVQPA